MDHICRIKFERPSKVEWVTNVQRLAHPRCLLFNCKNKASHVKCSEIPVDVKEAHMKWMKKICRTEQGFG